MELFSQQPYEAEKYDDMRGEVCAGEPGSSLFSPNYGATHLPHCNGTEN